MSEPETFTVTLTSGDQQTFQADYFGVQEGLLIFYAEQEGEGPEGTDAYVNSPVAGFPLRNIYGFTAGVPQYDTPEVKDIAQAIMDSESGDGAVTSADNPYARPPGAAKADPFRGGKLRHKG